MPDATEVEDWLQRATETSTRIDMSVSCPKCWKPIALNGGLPSDGKGCRCGTVATVEELKAAFGIEFVSGTMHSIRRRD